MTEWFKKTSKIFIGYTHQPETCIVVNRCILICSIRIFNWATCIGWISFRTFRFRDSSIILIWVVICCVDWETLRDYKQFLKRLVLKTLSSKENTAAKWFPVYKIQDNILKTKTILRRLLCDIIISIFISCNWVTYRIQNE